MLNQICVCAWVCVYIHTHTEQACIYLHRSKLARNRRNSGKSSKWRKQTLRNLNVFVSVQKTVTLYRYHKTITVRQILAPCLKGRDLQNKEMNMQYCMLAVLHWSKRAWALQEEILLTLMYYMLNRITLTWYQPTLMFSSQKHFATMLFAV